MCLLVCWHKKHLFPGPSFYSGRIGMLQWSCVVSSDSLEAFHNEKPDIHQQNVPFILHNRCSFWFPWSILPVQAEKGEVESRHCKLIKILMFFHSLQWPEWSTSAISQLCILHFNLVNLDSTEDAVACSNTINQVGPFIYSNILECLYRSKRLINSRDNKWSTEKA